MWWLLLWEVAHLSHSGTLGADPPQSHKGVDPHRAYQMPTLRPR